MVTCGHCAKLEEAFNRIREKESKLRAKFEAMSETVEDMKLQVQFLREENEMLRVMSVTSQPVVHMNQIPVDNVNKIVDEFGDVVQKQGNEIAQMINDRDRLATACLKSMAVISKQEGVIGRFRNAVDKMCCFVSQKGETAASVGKEFAMLGIEMSDHLDIIQRRFKVQEVCKGTGERISDADVVDVIENIATLNADSESLSVVTNYVTQQIDEKVKLRRAVERQKTRGVVYRTELGNVVEVLNMGRLKGHVAAEVSKRLSELRMEIRRLRNKEGLSRDIISVIVQFATRFGDADAGIKCCIDRMERWLHDTETADIAQEVDFILGMFKIQKKTNTSQSGMDYEGSESLRLGSDD